MKNAWIKKIGIVCCIWMTVVIAMTAQQEYLELKVEPIGQETSSWCWAASMQMIMTFHQIGTPVQLITQCNLAKELLKLQGTVPLADLSKNCCLRTCNGCAFTNPTCPTTTDYFNKTIDFTRQTDIPPKRGYFDLLFAKHSYTSMEMINQSGAPMTWEEIKEQIERCRPFIIIINGSGTTATNTPNGAHALVAKGYLQEDSSSPKFVIVNDPWNPCCKKEYYLPYNTIEGIVPVGSNPNPGFYGINSVLAFVHTIHPQRVDPNEGNTESCRRVLTARSNPALTPVQREFRRSTPTAIWEQAPPSAFINNTQSDIDLLASASEDISQFQSPPQDTTNEEQQDLTFLLTKNRNQVIGFRKDTLDNAELKQKTSLQTYYETPVEFISLSRMSEWRFFFCNVRLPSVIVPNQVSDVTYRDVNPPIISTLQRQKDGKTWVLKGITTSTFFQESLAVMVDNESITLNNTNINPSAVNTVKFTAVKFPPFLYEFYSFTYKEKNYFVPVMDYPDLDMKAGTAYRTEQSLRLLRRMIRNLDGFVRSPRGIDRPTSEVFIR